MDNEIDLYKLSEDIFNNNCKSRGSIQLTVEDDKNIKDIFEMLLIMFTEGMKIKYGYYDDVKKKIIVDLDNINDKKFMNINEYFNSFGFDCYFDKISYIDYLNGKDSFPLKINITDKNINNLINKDTKLADIKYTIKTENNIYSIYFDFINN